MRIISQDGTIGVPYEIGSLIMAAGKYENVEHAVIFCYNYSTSSGTKMAEYGSKEKAKKAMEELRYAYMRHGLAKMAKTLPGGNDEKINMGLSGVFQFPTEEELE